MRFYIRLAIDGMKKNSRLYVPYLLTCIGTIMMFYILMSLSYSPMVAQISGGDTMVIILRLGSIVIATFAMIFLFYTNTFLIRRRNKEFGLYNILGMNKWNISCIMFWETILTGIISVCAGLFCGILFSKLSELVLLRMAEGSIDYKLSIDLGSILATLILFGIIFGLMLIVSIARVQLSKPLDLLKSEAHGEKPPKANWILALIGLILLGVAYYLSVSIQSPLSAILLFFLAVLMVIVGTYLLFIAGSVALCRILQKNKAYYYKASHFVSVSSMVFRMKRNGAGLASICILATMVLVMLSSTSCLYFGSEDAMRGESPYDLTVNARYETPADCTQENSDKLNAVVSNRTKGCEDRFINYSLLATFGYYDNGEIDVNGTEDMRDVNSSASSLERIRGYYILPVSDYNRLLGTDITLSPGEAYVYSSGKPYTADTIALKGTRPLKVVGTTDTTPYKLSTEDTLVTIYLVMVADWYEYAAEIADYVESLGDPRLTVEISQYCSFDMPGTAADEQLRIGNDIRDDGNEMIYNGSAPGWTSFFTSAYEGDRNGFFSMYGSLFFIGIILSILFIAAAALIIYYKQLSEGYEDQNRFDIMQKVGMTDKEIKSTINAQVLTVFFAPLLLAGVHLAFAFPFVQKIIHLFGILNVKLLVITSILCFLAFAVFYVFVYRKTAKTYYSIVKGAV